MAQVILGGVGQALGGPFGKTLGGLVGQGLDRALIAGLEAPRQRGPRLDALRVQGTAEGAPLCCVFGRARVTGHIIWAARFLEDRRTRSAGKGGPRTTEYGYSLSFAVALCEGEIDGIGRVWADGQPMEMTGLTFRLHRGGEAQQPDSLIEAIEGDAPAYRGTAYVVFEDLPLAAFGNRVPQLAFEVFRRPLGQTPGLEDRLEGVCLIPGAGEFVLATEPVIRREGLARAIPENVHGTHAADFLASLDLLQAQAPNLKRVSLVIGWFGDDLRAGHCSIRPGVESRDKATEPLNWSVAGLGRAGAHLISTAGAGPAYGGTPSDETVRQAIRELKARGLEVTLYPFVFMDIPPDNGLPGPVGEDEQPAYPWRGRLRGREGIHAAADVGQVFGASDGWGLRRLALHYAGIAVESGADGLLIGSEMPGLTLTKDPDGQFPAVTALCELAAECRATVGPEVRLSYAADWTEYAGERTGADVRFHLDPLWASPHIDYVGVDWYPPMGDWRDGEGGLDAAGHATPDDPVYLSGQIEGGEGFDWFYASEADRSTQNRTPIIDTLAGEHWVYRVKDLSGWWGHAHYERRDGVRDAEPTAWIPGMKPVRLTEFGCGAIDRGSNAPNRFHDSKSSEGALPPHSSGKRDDGMQRRVLEAVLTHFAENNPTSAVYGGPMLEAADAWCWDARPWPAFPARNDVWGDAGNWSCGHWLNGRLHGETRDLLEAILRRAGVDHDEIAQVDGEVQGYVIDRPMPTRDALAPLLGALGLTVGERNGRIALLGSAPPRLVLKEAGLGLPADGSSMRLDRSLAIQPTSVRMRFIDGDRDYRTGAVLARQSGEGGGLDLDLPAVCTEGLAEAAARRALTDQPDTRLSVTLGPLEALRLEVGDVVGVEGRAEDWRIVGMETAETVTAEMCPVAPAITWTAGGGPTGYEPVVVGGAPFFRMMELPPLPGAEDDFRPLAIVAADPWRPQQVRGGPSPESLTVRAEVAEPATVGTLLSDLTSGPRHRWDEVNSLVVRVEGRAPESRDRVAVFAGQNVVAVETGIGWEAIQFREATLLGDDIWRLSGLLRGQGGTEGAMNAGAPVGSVVVFLDGPMTRVASSRSERGLPQIWRAGPPGVPGGPRVRELDWAPAGVHDRPLSPAHLRASVGDEDGVLLNWTPRARLDADSWGMGGDDGGVGRYRIVVRHGDDIRRAFEVEGTSAVYALSDALADFPDGIPGGVSAEVSQWGEGYGWGENAVVSL